MKKNGFPILWESRPDEQRQTTFIVSPQPKTLPPQDNSLGVYYKNDGMNIFFGCVF